MAEVNDDLNRQLGHMQGTQEQILAELRTLNSEFKDHIAEDNRNFSAIKTLMFGHLDIVDKKLALLTSDRDLARGAGMVLFGMFGLLATLAGSTISGFIRDLLKL